MEQMSYTLIRSKRKTISVTIGEDGSPVVRAPLGMPSEQVEAFLEQHRQWIHKHSRRAKEKYRQKSQFAARDGEAVPVLGRMVPIETLPDIAQPALGEESLFLGIGTREQRLAALEGFYRQLGARLLPELVARFSGPMGVSASGVRITGARKRWGSCSGTNSLCFSWRLMCMPPRAVEAVVVHELAHITRRDHSPAFYRLVEQVLPDYVERHALLKLWGERLPF